MPIAAGGVNEYRWPSAARGRSRWATVWPRPIRVSVPGVETKVIRKSTRVMKSMEALRDDGCGAGGNEPGRSDGSEMKAADRWGAGDENRGVVIERNGRVCVASERD